MHKLEIYGTLGPACASQPVLEQMLKAGMTGIRLNCSHTSLKEAESWLTLWNQAKNETGKDADLLIDLQGRELRTNNDRPVSVSQNKPVDMRELFGQTLLELTAQTDEIWIDDKTVHLTREKDIWKASADSIIGPRKSVYLPGVEADLPVFTEADIENLKEAQKHGVTAVMIPFVQDGQTVRLVRRALQDLGQPHMRIYAKLENRKGLEHAAEIMDQADITVFARGDLGMDIDLHLLPLFQDQFQQLAREKNADTMIVTQMLASMCEHPACTRAEAVDIYNAVKNGAAGIMLTNETAAGKYPVQAMETFVKTARTVKSQSES